MAHRLLSDPQSRCAVPHGHNEYIRVELSPLPSLSFEDSAWGAANRTHNFDQLKSNWHTFIDKGMDHSLQLSIHDPLIGYFQAHEPERLKNIVTIKGDPTTEALAIALSQKLKSILLSQNLPYQIDRLSLEETPTNTIVLTPSHETDLIDMGAWCHRADLSVNDLIPATSWASFSSVLGDFHDP